LISISLNFKKKCKSKQSIFCPHRVVIVLVASLGVVVHDNGSSASGKGNALKLTSAFDVEKAENKSSEPNINSTKNEENAKAMENKTEEKDENKRNF